MGIFSRSKKSKTNKSGKTAKIYPVSRTPKSSSKSRKSRNSSQTRKNSNSSKSNTNTNTNNSKLNEFYSLYSVIDSKIKSYKVQLKDLKKKNKKIELHRLANNAFDDIKQDYSKLEDYFYNRSFRVKLHPNDNKHIAKINANIAEFLDKVKTKYID